MLSKKMEQALNDQIQAEFYSAYLYLSMASHFDSANLSGFANWMRVQFEEEQFHALKLFDYVLERGGEVKLQAIEQPKHDWDNPVALFEEVLAHEQHVTALIHKLVDLAIAESDHGTNQMLQWFVEEQVEEEAAADTILQELKLIGENSGGLFMMNRELAQRTFTPPAAGE